jgi:D-threonate/D-erythronate kinase
MRRILILADDLSGAADCANACMHSGLSAVVSFEESEDIIESDVLSIDCDTRHLTPEQASARVASIMRKHTDDARGQLVFKKVDSTLRGNVGAEIRAVLEELRKASADNVRVAAVLAPAFPSGGRTTIGGYQLVHGVPLHETEMWKHDGLLGVAHMPTMLQRAGLHAATLDLGIVRESHDHLAAAMRRAATEADVLICDAETDEDLQIIAHGAFQLGREIVWAGSAGLAYQLPRAASVAGTVFDLQKPACLDGPMLFVVGSMSSVSHRQAVLLEQEVPIHAIRISPQVLLRGSSKPEWTEVAQRVSLSMDQGVDTLVVLGAAERVDLHERRMLTDALGQMLSPCADKVRALAATGGETARAIFNGWKIPSLKIIGEVERGIPCSILELNGRSIPVVTKAGAFGQSDALIVCWHFLANLLGHYEPVPLKKTS